MSNFPWPCCIGIPPPRAGSWEGMNGSHPALANAGLTLWLFQHAFSNTGWYLINQEIWARIMCKNRHFYILWKVWKSGEICEMTKKTAAVEGMDFLVWNDVFSDWGLNLFHMEMLAPWVLGTAKNLRGITSNMFVFSFSDCWHILSNMWPEKAHVNYTIKHYHM